MTRRGFTIVELIITITIMGILLTLAVVNLTSTQLQSRDAERKGDIEAIGAAMETFYTAGNGASTTLGRYPSTGIASTSSIKANLPDANIESFKAPGVETLSLIISTNTGTAKAIQTTAGVEPKPTKDQYVYQPIRTDGSICGSGGLDCRKFNLFYRLEADDTVYKVTSKNQ